MSKLDELLKQLEALASQIGNVAKDEIIKASKTRKLFIRNTALPLQC